MFYGNFHTIQLMFGVSRDTEFQIIQLYYLSISDYKRYRQTSCLVLFIAFEMNNVDSSHYIFVKKICSHIPCVFQAPLLIGEIFKIPLYTKILLSGGP